MSPSEGKNARSKAILLAAIDTEIMNIKEEGNDRELLCCLLSNRNRIAKLLGHVTRKLEDF
jgi:hypothetical protein